MGKVWEDKTGQRGRWRGLPAGTDPFWLLVDSVKDYGIFLVDADGVIQSWNTGAHLITGHTADEAIGRHIQALYTKEEVETGWPARELDMAARSERVEDEGWRLRKDGQRFWANVVTTAMRGPDGALYGYSMILRDLTERKQREDTLKRSVDRSRQLWTQAVKDPLTGAFNRRYMTEQLRGAVERSGWVTSSLVVFDIDHFKTVNDRFGHAVGDTVLMGIAALARRLSRDSDLLFRLGGDEFVMYLPGVGRTGALAIGERLRVAVESSALIPQGHVSISLGIAELEPQESPEVWLKRADAALYDAKRGGRNKIG